MADLTTLQGLRRSPLQDMAAELRNGSVQGDRAVLLREWPFLTMVNIRVEPGSETAGRIEGVLGASLPQQCGDVTGDGAHSVLWLGPDEWLVISQAAPESLVGSLQSAAEGGRAQIVDVSANRTVVEVTGPGAREVLEKGCPTDLHPRAFADNTAISTSLARVPVLLWKVDANTFRVMPRASLASYVGVWLLDAVAEFGPRASAVEGV
ncbi:sarcosine oxidase subunit gamma [Nocardioides gansuensis]|uniref:Sarcosine oxidase subunit gamma n=1 Tax=Nocardioides gansuensis TaxID=2138300 RepID=A0A2T8F5D4_9ACTN|nr:sarcosine oxidase subunit gamma family protein [Nocardioides gansuensis]PVG80913.1 sarcosine oxidase subunit gamma [Nocardioides gansuensis]